MFACFTELFLSQCCNAKVDLTSKETAIPQIHITTSRSHGKEVFRFHFDACTQMSHGAAVVLLGMHAPKKCHRNGSAAHGWSLLITVSASIIASLNRRVDSDSLGLCTSFLVGQFRPILLVCLSFANNRLQPMYLYCFARLTGWVLNRRSPCDLPL